VDLNNISARINAAQTQKLLAEDQSHLLDTRQEIRGAISENIALAALQSGQLDALQDTMEDLSLLLGSRLKDIKNKNDKSVSDPRHALLEQLAEDRDLSLLNIELGDLDTLMTLLDSEEVPFDQGLLLLASWGENEALDGQKRKKIKDRLTALMDANPEWALEMFATLELGDVSPQTLSPLLQVMKRHQDKQDKEEAENLWEWFEEISDWPERDKRVRVLIRTLAVELSFCTDESHQKRLVATIKDLKKLLLFLGIEERSAFVAKSVELPARRVMKELLHTIEQTWITDSWVAHRLVSLSLTEDKHILYLGRFTEILKYLPDLCFLDDAQRSQILEAFTAVYDRLSDEE
jgi:type III secretion system TyeA family effector delivery regulator